MSQSKFWVCACWLLLGSALQLLGQGYRGTITGKVIDPTGRSVPGATVKATNLNDNAVGQATTDGNGYYAIPYLSLGPYKLAVEARGFKASVREGFDLRVNDHLSIDISLQVGEVKESVTVSGEAPLLTPDSASLGGVISNRQVVDLPLNGRNAFALQQLQVGVIPTGQSGNVNLTRPWDTNSVSDITVNGAPNRGNMITLNGVYSKGGNQVSYTPSIDAVQEFKVQRNSYDAEYGHVAGGTINVATKTGTNEFHGSAYEFIRNNHLDANTFFNNKNGTKKALFQMNQFGATIGGPAMLPKLYNGKDKTFWFFNYESVRQGQPPSTSLLTVPTDAQRSGDFSSTLFSNGSLITLYDPLTTRPDPVNSGKFLRDPFTGNKIPANRVNAISKNVMAFIPGPNLPGLPVTGLNNYIATGGGKQDYDQWGTRVDHEFGSATRMFAFVGIANFTNANPNIFHNIATDSGALQNTRSVALDVVHSFSPRLIMNVRYGYARKLERSFYASDGYDPAQLGFPAALVSQLPHVNFPSFGIGDAGGSFGIGGPSFNASDGHNLTGIMTRATGRHTVKFGTYILLMREFDDRGGGGGSAGQYSFGRDWTQMDPYVPSATQGFGFATFLLGYPSSGQTSRGAMWATQTVYYEFFVQDDFKVTPRLTLNLGMRYEYQGGTTDRFDRILRDFNPSYVPSFAAAAQAAYAASPISQVPASSFKVTGGTIFAAVNGVTRNQLDPERSSFAPRFGLAYRVSNRMVWRLGGGTFYNPRLTGINITGFNVVTPMVTTLDGLVPYNTLSNPFPSGLLQNPAASRSQEALVGQSFGFTNPKNRTPRIVNWSTGFQYELPKGILVEASYVGSDTARFNLGRPLNMYDPKYLALGSGLNQQVSNPFYGLIPANTGALGAKTVALQQLLAPYPEYTVGGFSYAVPGIGHNRYHSGQFSVERRFAGGLGVLASYTISKLMTRSSFMNGNYSDALESVIADIDRPQRLVTTFVWELPFGRGRSLGRNWSGPVNHLLGGWQLNGIGSFQSGQAIPISGVIATGQPAHLSSGQSIDYYLNKAAFAVQPSFTLRTMSARLSDVRTPGINNWDLSVVKDFRAFERMRVQFRSEFFNAFNRTQFGNPDTGINSSTFGRISSQYNIPRQIQFGLKILF
jgi:hypothetical protein